MGMMTMTHLRRSRLSALALKTALGTSLVVLAAPMAAQVAPDTVPLAPTSNRPQTRFDTVANGAGGQTLTVDLRNRPSTIINWRSFDIGADSTARFVSTNGEVANLTDAFSVLNRVTSGNPTTILGRLTSQPNISVFLLNGSGIVFGAGSVVSTGSFVASTLDIGDRTFTRGKFRFTQGEGLGGSISVAEGATLRSTGADGMRRGVVLVAPAIDSVGQVEGGGGDVAFVSAADVTLNLRPGSPLGISIARGLPVQASQVVGGRIGGQNVYLALATEAEVTASLLQVDGKVRAVGTGNGVVIVAGEAQSDAPGVDFRRGSNADATRGVVDIATSAGSALRSAGSITVEGRGTADVQGLVSARGDLSATLLGDADFVGPAIADGNVRIAGAGLDVANVRTGGSLTMRAREGALALGNGVAGGVADLRAAGDLTIATQLRTGGAARLTAGANARVARVQTADGGIFISARNGEVTGAEPERGAILNAGRRDDGTGDALGIRAAGLVQIGRASASSDLTIISADGSIEGRRLAGGAISLIAAEGGIMLDRAVAGEGMRLAAGQDIVVDGALRAQGALTLLSNGTTSVGVAASETANVRIRADAITLGVARAGGALNLSAVDGGIAAGRGSAAGVARLGATGDIAIARGLSAGGQVTIRAGGEVAAERLRSTGDDVKVAAAAIDVGKVQSEAVLRLQANSGDLSIERGIAGTTAYLRASGTVTAEGLVAAGSRLTVDAGAAAELATVRARGGLFLDAAGGDLSIRAASAGDRAALSAAGDIAALGRITASGDLSILAGGSATLADVAAEGGDLRVVGQSIELADARTGGRLALTATAGGIALRSGRAETAVRIDAIGDVRIARGLSAGNGLRVDGGGATSLGVVSAGGLLTISGTDVAIRSASAGGDLALTARDGGIALGTGTAGGRAALTATGDIRVRQTLAVGNSADVAAGGAARLGTITSDRGSVAVSGTTVSVRAADSARALALQATSGSLRVGEASARSSITFSAAGAVRAFGPIAAGRDVTANAGGEAALGDVEARRGDVTVRADRLSVAGVRAGRALVLEATGGNATIGSAIAGTTGQVTATGAITATGLLAAREDLMITAGRGVAVGTARAQTGDLQMTGGRVTAARLIAGEALAVAASRGDVTLGSASARGSADIAAAGALTVSGAIEAGTGLVLRAGGDATAAKVAAGTGDLDVDARSITFGRVTAGGDIALRARRGDLRLRSASSGANVALAARGAIDVAGRVSAEGSLWGRAGEGADFGALRAGAMGDLRVRADAITLGSATAGDTLDLRARAGAVSIRSAVAGGTLRLDATGDVTVARQASGARIGIEAGGAADLGTLSGTSGRVEVTAGSIAARSVDAAGRLRLEARSGSLRALRLSADGAAVITAAGEVRVRDALTSGRSVDVAASDVARIGTMAAGGDLVVAGARVRVGSAVAGDRLDLRATGGALSLGNGSAGGEAVLVAAEGLTVSGTLESAARAMLTGGADLRLGMITAGGDLTIDAGGGAVRGVDAAGGTLVAGGTGTIRVDAGGAVDLAMLDAGGRGWVRGASVAVDRVSTGGRLTLSATQGRLAIGDATAGGSALLDSAGELIVSGALTAGGDATLFAADSMRLGSIRAEGGVVALSAAGEVTGYPTGRGAILAATTREGVGGGITVEAGGVVRLASAQAEGSVAVRSDATIAAGLIRAAGGIRLDAAGGATGLGDGGMRLIAGGNRGIVVDAGGAIRVRSARSGGDLRLTGRGIEAGRLTAADLLSVEARGADLSLEHGRAGGDARLTAAGDILVAERLTGETVQVRAGGDAGLGRVTAREGALGIRAMNGAVTGAIPGGGAVLTAAGGVSVLGDRLVRLDTVEAGEDVRIRAAGSGEVVLGAVDAAGVLAVDSGTIAGGTLIAGGRVDAVARAGSIVATRVVANGGDVDLVAAEGMSLGTVRAAGAVLLNADGAVNVAGLALAGADLRITAAGVEVGNAVAVGRLALTATGGRLSIGQGDAGVGAVLDATGELEVTRQLVAGEDVTLRAGGDATMGVVTARDGDVLVDARQGVVTAAALTGGAVEVYAGPGATLAEVTGTRSGVTVVTGASVAAPGAGSGGGVADLGTVMGAGAVTVRAGSIVAESIEATTGALDLSGIGGAATDAIVLGTGSAGGDLTIAGAGAVEVTGPLNSDGAVRIVTGVERSAALGAVTAATTLAIDAGDLALAGTVTAASATIRSNAAAGVTLGDGPTGGLHLANAEVGLIDVPELVFDAGSGAVRMGAIAFGASTGDATTTIATTGAVEVTGAVTAAADGRIVAIGGAAEDAASRAGSITIVADAAPGGAASGGGRLNFDGNILHLRGDRIAAGQREGFLDVLGGLTDAQAVADRFVNNARSALYAARQPYPDAPVLVSAKAMSVRYGTYALFQNTGRLTTAAGVSGSRTGVVIGTPGEGPSLTLRSDGAGSGNAFAMFGTIAGTANESAAVVGETILSTQVDGADTIVIRDSRVNGCIIGTGAGCLTTPIGIPPVNIFDPSRLNVFVPADFEIAFDPVIGSNNEALFAGIAAIDVPSESELPFDPAIGSNNEALFTGAADDAAAGEDGCPEDPTGRTCPRKESRK